MSSSCVATIGERGSVSYGEATAWQPAVGGWLGKGASGRRYVVTSILEHGAASWWSKDKLMVLWRLTGAGLPPQVFAGSGEALDAADVHEARLVRARGVMMQRRSA